MFVAVDGFDGIEEYATFEEAEKRIKEYREEMLEELSEKTVNAAFLGIEEQTETGKVLKCWELKDGEMVYLEDLAIYEV